MKRWGPKMGAKDGIRYSVGVQHILTVGCEHSAWARRCDEHVEVAVVVEVAKRETHGPCVMKQVDERRYT